MVTQTQKEKFIELRAEGITITEASAQIGISQVTGSKLETELKTAITTLKNIRLSSLYEQYGMMKEARIRSLGRQLQKIEAELASRNFQDCETKDLLAMALRYRKALDDEFSPIALGQQLGEQPDSNDIQRELVHLLERCRHGMTTEQVEKELKIITTMLKTSNEVNTQSSLNAILNAMDK